MLAYFGLSIPLAEPITHHSTTPDATSRTKHHASTIPETINTCNSLPTRNKNPIRTMQKPRAINLLIPTPIPNSLRMKIPSNLLSKPNICRYPRKLSKENPVHFCTLH